MRRVVLLGVLWLCSLLASGESRAALTLLDQFDPVNAGSLCGVGFDQSDGGVWVYACSAADVQRYSSTGAFLSAVPRPGESANDVDVEFAPTALALGATTVPEGSLLFVNGETGVADIYAVDKLTGAVIASLNTSFGISHVVGGAYHTRLARFFLVQDNVPGAADENRVATIDTVTGLVLSSFQTTATFSVNFGDIEVCHATRNLLVVSSVETSIAEFTPLGAFVQSHPLPAGVSSLSGIGVDDATGEIWVSGTGGAVWRLGGDACAATPLPIPALPMVGLFVLGLVLVASLTVTAQRRS
jgi:hypothetical protein